MTGRSFAAAFVCLVIQARAPCAAQESRIFPGLEAWQDPGSVRVSEQELLFNDRHTGGFQSRSYYFTGYLNDEIHFELSVFRWRYALFGGWGLQVVTVEAGKPPFVFEERMPYRAVSAAADRFRIGFGDNLLEGRQGDYRVSLRLEGFSCDLEFHSQISPWRPGDGCARLDEAQGAYIRLGIPAPLARVRGSLSLAGHARPVEGWGYADRSLIATPIRQMCSPTYAFRAFSSSRDGGPEWFVSLLRYDSHPDFGPVSVSVLLLIEGQRWVLASREPAFFAAALVQDARVPVVYPRRMEVHVVGEGEVRLDGAFVGSPPYHCSDIFDKIPAPFRALVNVFFDRPVIVRLLGTFHGTLTLPDGSERELHLPGHGEYTVVR